MVSRNSEKAILGHIVKTQKIPIGLDINDFGDNANQQLFSLINTQIEKQVPIDFEFLSSNFRESEKEKIINYLNECVSLPCDNIDNTVHHLKDLRARRYLKKLSTDLLTEVNDPQKKNLDIIGQIEDSLLKLPTYGDIDTKIINPESYVEWRRKGLSERRTTGTAFLGTGLAELDEDLADGFSPKIVSCIAGESSHGKSTMAAFSARYIASRPNRNEHVLFFCPESTAMKIADRYDVQLTGIPIKEIQNIMNWEKNDKRFELLKQAAVTQSKWRYHRLDVRGLSGRELVSAIEVYKKRVPQLSVVFIDTLQDLRENIDWANEGGSQNAALERLMYFLEVKSYELNIHICLISQYNRDKQAKQAKVYRPDLDRLRGSGSVGQKCTWVLHPFRPFRAYGEDSDNRMDLWLVKNRDGDSMCYHSYEFLGDSFSIGNYIGKNI